MNNTTDVVAWVWNMTTRWSEISLMDMVMLVKEPLVQFIWTDPIDSVSGDESPIWMRLLSLGFAPFNFLWRWYFSGVVIMFLIWVIFSLIWTIVHLPYQCLQILGGMVHGKSADKPISGSIIFPSPSRDYPYPHHVFQPRSLVELEMLRLMGVIKEKSGWYVKIENDEIVSKWKSEAKSQSSRLSDACLNYCMDELKYEAASLRSASSTQPHIQSSAVPGVYQSDDIIEPKLKAALIAGAMKLETVPEDRKDYHPGTNRQVLNLIHPSMYCHRIGETPLTRNFIPLNETLTSMGLERPPKSTRFIKAMQSILPTKTVDFYESLDEYNTSKQFQWLPSEFTVNDQNEVTIDSYINNLHPIHDQTLYQSIGQIFQRFIPLFERVLNDLIAPHENRTGAQYTPHPTYWRSINDDWRQLTPEELEFSPPIEIPATDEHGVMLPPPPDPDGRMRLFIRPFRPSQPITVKGKNSTNFELKGRKLQVIVKLANIILTPDQPNYTGGSWHVEGMKNESIVASGIYYYHSENISESRLAFRTAVQEPRDYEQGDEEGVRRVYGLEQGGKLNQPLGSVLTMSDRCIAFPNIYQHQVQPFHLTDPTRSGQRKILVFFLVDPGVRILSTAHVPPQQLSWLPHSSPYHQLLLEQTNLIPPIIDLVLSYHCDDFGLMDRSQAEAVRLELMKERKYFVDTKNTRLFERDFSLCEH